MNRGGFNSNRNQPAQAGRPWNFKVFLPRPPASGQPGIKDRGEWGGLGPRGRPPRSIGIVAAAIRLRGAARLPIGRDIIAT